jgi:ferritin-like metal-binding protein YciE
MTPPNLPQDFFGDDAAGPFAVDLRAPITTLPRFLPEAAEPAAGGEFEKHWLHTLAHVLTEEIQELFSAEKQAAAMWPRIARAATDPVLWAVCQAETAHATAHEQRLERVQEMLGRPCDGRICAQMESLLLGVEETIAENHTGPARDRALVAAARKVKQFEIAGYCSARDFAQLLGLGPVAELLQQTLDEETTMDARLGIYGEILEAQTGAPEYR